MFSKPKTSPWYARKRERRFISSFVMTMRATGFVAFGVGEVGSAQREASVTLACSQVPSLLIIFKGSSVLLDDLNSGMEVEENKK